MQELRHAQLQSARSSAVWIFGTVLGGLGLITLISLALLVTGHTELAWFPGTIGGLVGVIAGTWSAVHTYRRRAAPMVGQPLYPDLLAAWSPVIELPRLERSYFDALVVLADERGKLDASSSREILTHLNSLMARNRELDLQRESILNVLDTGNSTQLQAERDDLLRRGNAATDPIARRSLEVSLRMCDERIDNLGKLKPALERLEAQQVAIVQTVASIQSSLARWQAAPTVSDLPDLGQIQQSVGRINDETYAVEQAVQEVMIITQ